MARSDRSRTKATTKKQKPTGKLAKKKARVSRNGRDRSSSKTVGGRSGGRANASASKTKSKRSYSTEKQRQKPKPKAKSTRVASSRKRTPSTRSTKQSKKGGRSSSYSKTPSRSKTKRKIEFKPVVVPVYAIKRKGAPKPPDFTEQNTKGKPYYFAPVRINKPRGGRPPGEKIKGWIGRRRNARWWRNRDGSYDCVVTIRSPSGAAWKLAENVILGAPRPCYVCLRFTVTIHVDKGGKQKAKIYRGKEVVFQLARGEREIVKSSPIARVTREAVQRLMAWPLSDLDTRKDIAGFSIFWPAMPAKEG